MAEQPAVRVDEPGADALRTTGDDDGARLAVAHALRASTIHVADW